MADESHLLGNTVNNPKVTVYNQRNLAKIAAANGYFEQAIAHFKHGLSEAEEMNERMQYLNILIEIGTAMISIRAWRR